MGAIKNRGKKKIISKKFHKKKKSLYFSNRKEYYRRKRISESLKKSRIKLGKRSKRLTPYDTSYYPEYEPKIYRYSVAYYNSGYDKTFRAEVYSNKKLEQGYVHNLLSSYLRNYVSRNSGMSKLFAKSTTLGLESEEVGQNDLQGQQLNRIKVSFE